MAHNRAIVAAAIVVAQARLAQHLAASEVAAGRGTLDDLVGPAIDLTEAIDKLTEAVAAAQLAHDAPSN
jgi:hypothetical protein